jgi:hypothetical protein
MSPVIRPFALLYFLISLSAQAQTSRPQFIYPTLTWGICENAKAVDLGLLLGTSYNGSITNLHYSILTSPLHGTMSLSSNAVMPPDGNFGVFQPSTATYTPNAGYTGTDMAVFQVSDGTTSSQMTLSLTVVPPPPQPGAIIGPDVDTVGQDAVTYSFSGPIDPNAVYNWTYSGSNIFISGAPFAGTGDPVQLSLYPYPTATSGVLSVTAGTSCGTSPASTKTITVMPIQFITFDSIPPHTYGYFDFHLSARSTSKLPVRFVIADTTIARFTTDWTGSLLVHIIKAGQTTITAFQDGMGGLQPATPVVRQLVVRKLDQFITYFSMSVIFRLGIDIPPTLNTTASSGLPVQYMTSDTRIATIYGNQINFPDSGTVTITATQPGDSIYNPAPSVSVTIQVMKPLKLANGAFLFPNPSHGSFYCRPDPAFKADSYALYSTSGQRVAEGRLYNLPLFVVNAGNVAPGIYLMKVLGNKDGKNATLQFTVLINN